MKTRLSLIIGGLALLGSPFLLSQNAMAIFTAPQTFTVSATMPLAGSIGITVSSVTTPGNVFTVINTTALSFDPLTFNATNNIYLPNHYFALDIAAQGGGGEPDTTLTYTEGANPNGRATCPSAGSPPAGMGCKSTATFASETYTSSSTPPTETILSQGKQMMISLSGLHIPYTEFTTGQWLRIYLGIWTGSTQPPADPANGQPFSNADAAGLYSGSLLVTSVVN